MRLSIARLGHRAAWASIGSHSHVLGDSPIRAPRNSPAGKALAERQWDHAGLCTVRRLTSNVSDPTAQPLAPAMANRRCLDASESLLHVARCRNPTADRRSGDIEGIARATHSS